MSVVQPKALPDVPRGQALRALLYQQPEDIDPALLSQGPNGEMAFDSFIFLDI